MRGAAALGWLRSGLWRGLGLALLLCASPAAHAYVPDAERVEGAVVQTNRGDGRDEAIRIEAELRIDGGPVVGHGEFVLHPGGLARLELRGRGGIVERHLLLGTDHIASRNGEPLSDPRSFLPPLFLLQIDSRTALRAALEGLGADPDSIGLAPCGDRDCFVVGDPRRIVPPPPAPEPPLDPDAEAALEAELAGSGDEGLEDAPEIPFEPAPQPPPALHEAYATLWVDIEGYEIVGIQGVDGVKVRMGPIADFERVRIPSWVEIEEPDRGVARFDIRGVAAVEAPAAVFGKSWVTTPELPGAPDEGNAGAVPEESP